MSINDHRLAELQANKADGEESDPEATVEEKKNVSVEDAYQEGSQGTVERLNRETGRVEEVPADPATTPAPGLVEKVDPKPGEIQRLEGVEHGDQPKTADGRDIADPEIQTASEIPLVDENYRPVAFPDEHDGPVFEYSPTVSDQEAAEENLPVETKSDEERRAEVAGTTRENQVEADLARETSARDRGDVTTQSDIAEASSESVPGEGTPVAGGTQVEGTFQGTTVEGDSTYEAEKAAATERVPTSASNKQEIKDYLIYQHGIDPDDLQDQTKTELLDMVNDLAE